MGTDEMPLTAERALDRNITRHKTRMGWLIEGLDTLLAWHRAGRPEDER